MERGWNATGKLKPHWDRLPGKSAELARLTGIGRGTLSSYNSGRLPLGIVNARKIALALDVTIYDLGAPRSQRTDAEVRPTLSELAANQEGAVALLRELADSVAQNHGSIEELRADVAGLRDELAGLRTLVESLRNDGEVRRRPA